LHGLQRSARSHDAELLRGEIGDALELKRLAHGQHVADLQLAVVVDADDVPATASFMCTRSLAMKVSVLPIFISRPWRRCCTFMPGVKRPEQTRKKAMRSRCPGSMLAWTLNTKP